MNSNFRLPLRVVNEARQAVATSAWQEERVARLETQVRLLAQIAEKLVTLHPEAQEAVAYETTITHVVLPTISTSRDDFYASREAKTVADDLERIRAAHQKEREAEDLYLQRRRNFPLDPPSSADPEWDADL